MAVVADCRGDQERCDCADPQERRCDADRHRTARPQRPPGRCPHRAPRHARPVELGILLQDLRLEPPESLSRLEPELVDEESAAALVRVERVGLASRAVQREHELRAQAFSQGVGLDELLEVGDELRVAADGKLGIESILERRQAKLLEPRDLGLGECLVGEILQRRPAPERQSFAERVRGLREVPRGKQAATFCAKRVEAIEIDLPGGDPQEVAAAMRDEDLRIERLPKIRDVDANDLPGCLWGSFGP